MKKKEVNFTWNDEIQKLHNQPIQFTSNQDKPVVNERILPTEDEIIDTILKCVDIRGIELELYRREFTEERSGLITALHKLYSQYI